MSLVTNLNTDEAIVIHTGDHGLIYSVAFHPDGAHLFSGSAEGVRQWHVADGQEVGTRMGTVSTNAISVSRDRRWIVCGTEEGASVWDAKTQEMAIEVEGGTYVDTVDISPDSTRFATGTGMSDRKASIWNILTGERLVGPLEHDGPVRDIKFSPNGEQIATVCPVENSVYIFDSRNGDQLVKINISGIVDRRSSITPLAWSSNQHIFVASGSKTIMSFDVSTGSQLAEWQVHDDGNVESIALASNGKFLATFAWYSSSISFWDTSTHSQICPVVEDGQMIRSIALSPDCNYLATGRYEGKITIRNLSNVLPDSYGPFLAPTQEGSELGPPKDKPWQQQDEQPSTMDVNDKKPPDSTLEQPTTSGQPESETHHEDSNDNLLEVGLPSSTSAQLFDYSEPPSPASSAGPRQVHVTPPRSLQVIPQLAAPLSIVSPPETSFPTKPLDTPGSSQGISVLARWLPGRFKKTLRDQGSQSPDQPATRSGRSVNLGFRSQSRSRESTPKKEPPTMAAGQRARRTVWKSPNLTKGNIKTAEASHRNKDAASNEQGSAGTQQASTVQQGHEPSQSLTVPGVQAHITQHEAGNATVSVAFAFNLPAWMLCFRSGTEDGRH